MSSGVRPSEVVSLLDWKRRVFLLYERVRSTEDALSAWRAWRDARDALFKGHEQSPIPESERAGFTGLDLFDYSPSFRTTGKISAEEPVGYEIGTSGEGTFSFTRFATVTFELSGSTQSLELYWVDGYGGGLFLPFRDGTSGTSTYGAGRYLFDTVKGADLGMEGDRLVLDFNFAYNPSCSYDPRWVCPLAPPANRLDVPVEAGERHRNE
jgi:uncharacterized protein (DUF1684 family)